MTIELVLSHSQVQSYHGCKFKYYLKYVEGWVTVSTADMNRGTWIHEALNYGYTVNCDVNKINKYLGTKIADANAATRGDIARYARIVQRYFEEFVPASDQEQVTLALEKEFTIELISAQGRPFKLRGFIDRIFMWHNRIFVEDFKTLGKASWWDQVSLMMDSQLTTYGAIVPFLSVEELGLAVPQIDGVAVTQINCYSYKKGEPAITDLVRREKAYRTEREMSNMLIELSYVADEIIAQLEGDKPFTRALTRSCNRCEFADACQFGMRGVNMQPFLASRFTKKNNPLSEQITEMKADAD